LFKIPGPPKCKTHKYTVEEFQKVIGVTIERSVMYVLACYLPSPHTKVFGLHIGRYDNLYLFGEVKLRYQPQAGIFKISGMYGK
jgi:hypothetical protein